MPHTNKKNTLIRLLCAAIMLLKQEYIVTNDYESTNYLCSPENCNDFDELESSQSVLFSQEELRALEYEQDNDECYLKETKPEELFLLRTPAIKKPITLLNYIAADNDLHAFAWKNIKQMEAVGSNHNINIVVQINTPGYANPTKRYFIKNGKRLLITDMGAAPTTKLNSGSPKTLVDAAAWAMKYFPAEHLVINMWDHGSGIYDPGMVATVNSSDIFKMNEQTGFLELDKNIQALYSDEENQRAARGICFDETFKSYMSSHDLKYALSEIQKTVLHGKKIAIVWFDACLMAMLEIADTCKDHVDFLVGSQEVEYASGSNYEMVLRPFLDKPLSPRDLATHIVNCFGRAYQNITQDYTQSAMDLSVIDKVQANASEIAEQIITALKLQKDNSVVKFLQQCKNPPLCSCFQERSYIDLKNFYMNMKTYLSQIRLTDARTESSLKSTLNNLLEHGMVLIKTAVIANKTGNNFQKAGGISIYFPERIMFNSYPKSNFAKTNSWFTMLCQYLLCKK